MSGQLHTNAFRVNVTGTLSPNRSSGSQWSEKKRKFARAPEIGAIIPICLRAYLGALAAFCDLASSPIRMK